MWHPRRQTTNLVEHGARDLRKTGPYKDDFIMENGVKLLLRTYISESTIRIDDFDTAFKVYGGDVIYLLDNKLHRMNGPAFIRKNELYLYLRNGKFHRDGDSPAIESYDDSYKVYYKNGIKHRENGPAVIVKGSQEFWLNGVQIKSEERFINGVRHIRLNDILFGNVDDLEIVCAA